MKINRIICAALLSMMFLSACSKKENMTVYTGGAEVSFKTQKDYTILCEAADDDGVKNYYVEVGVTTPSAEDRKITLQVNPIKNYQGPYSPRFSYKANDVILKDNNTYIANKDIVPGTTWRQGVVGATWKAIYMAKEGVHYTIEKSVIIPAGKLIGRVKVTPNFDNVLTKNMSVSIKIFRVYTFGTKIAGYCSDLNFNLVKFTPFNEAALLGSYYYSGKVPCSLEKTEFEGLYKMVGAIEDPIYFSFVYKNRSDFHTIVDKRTDGAILLHNYVVKKDDYGDIKLKTRNEKGAFDMYEKTFTLMSDAYGKEGKYPFSSLKLTFKKR
ncbi:MAG: hypothetical protein WBG43_02970 [Marinifilaceae bacterium]